LKSARLKGRGFVWLAPQRGIAMTGKEKARADEDAGKVAIEPSRYLVTVNMSSVGIQLTLR
jgi:hypothetical protein